MIKANNIHDMNHVKSILDELKYLYSQHENQTGNSSGDIEEEICCQFCEIDEFIVGAQQMKPSNLIQADIRMMIYWKYIDDKLNYFDMVEAIKNHEGDYYKNQ